MFYETNDEYVEKQQRANTQFRWSEREREKNASKQSHTTKSKQNKTTPTNSRLVVVVLVVVIVVFVIFLSSFLGRQTYLIIFFSRNANLAVVRRQKWELEWMRKRGKTVCTYCVVCMVVSFAHRCVPSWTWFDCALSKVNRIARVTQACKHSMPSQLRKTCASFCPLSSVFTYFGLFRSLSVVCVCALTACKR